MFSQIKEGLYSMKSKISYFFFFEELYIKLDIKLLKDFLNFIY